MKIAIVGFGFVGSTLPLIEALIKEGHRVDYYFCVFTTQKGDSFEAFEIDSIPSIPQLKKITGTQCKGLESLSNREEFNIYRVTHLGTGSNKKNILKWFIKNLSIFFVYIYTLYIRCKKYDYINVIGQIELSAYYNIFLRKNKNSHTLHEVLENHGKANTTKLVPILRKMLKFNTPIVLHSKKSYNDLKEKHPNIKNKCRIIPFGLFKTYNAFIPVYPNEIKDISNYILIYGYITEYKGLNILYDSILLVKKQIPNIKVVVAGKGSVPILKQITIDESFILLNRWITNNEIMGLIKKSKFIVCPYISASQSGIPQTSFLLRKPIIATTVGAFPEIINDKENGLLIPPKNPQILAESIIRLYKDTQLYNSMVNKIKKIDTWDNLDWQKISNSHLEFIKSL